MAQPYAGPPIAALMVCVLEVVSVCAVVTSTVMEFVSFNSAFKLTAANLAALPRAQPT